MDGDTGIGHVTAGAYDGGAFGPARAARLSRVLSGLVACCVLFGSLALAHTHGVGPPCLFRMVAHIPCPGCGLTRSVVAVWRGAPLTSFRYHPLGIAVFGASVIVLLGVLVPRLAQPRGPIGRLGAALARPRAQYAIVGVLIGTWLVRLAFILGGSRFFLW